MEETWRACLNCKKPVVGRCTVCEHPLCQADMDAWVAGDTPCALAHGPHVALVVRSERKLGSRRGRIAIALAGSGHLLGEVTGIVNLSFPIGRRVGSLFGAARAL